MSESKIRNAAIEECIQRIWRAQVFHGGMYAGYYAPSSDAEALVKELERLKTRSTGCSICYDPQCDEPNGKH